MMKKKKILIGVLVAALLCGGIAFVSMNEPKGIKREKIDEHTYRVTHPDGTSVNESLTPARGE